jgi:hypothetical protein
MKLLIFLAILNLSTALVLNKQVMQSMYPGGYDSPFLELTNRDIESIEGFTFEGLANLSELYLESNEIISIEQFAFSGLANL